VTLVARGGLVIAVAVHVSVLLPETGARGRAEEIFHPDDDHDDDRRRRADRRGSGSRADGK